MARLESRSEFARIAGVSPAAITKACKGPLAPACIGKRIDLDHAAVRAYLAIHGVALPDRAPTSAPLPSADPADHGVERGRQPDPTTRAPRRRRRPTGRAVEPSDSPPPDDVETFVDLTLRELTDRFGTETNFKDWLDARKKIADIREKDLKNDETEGRLIERELVRTHIFGSIEASHRRLLGDMPKTIARRLYALVKAGAPVEEAEAVIREVISSQLKPVKTTAARVLRDA